METLDKLAYNILNKLVGGRSTNNEYISLEQIKYNINHYRALFIRRDIREDDDLSYFEQEIPLQFQQNTTTDNKLNVIVGSESINALPQTIRLKHRKALYIYNNAEDKIIPLVTYHRAKYQNYNKFTKNDQQAFVKNNKVFVNKEFTEILLSNMKQGIETNPNKFIGLSSDYVVRGVFTFPEEAMIVSGTLPNETGKQEYPISGDLAQRITEGILRGTLPLMLETPNDTKLDTIPPNQAEQ